MRGATCRSARNGSRDHRACEPGPVLGHVHIQEREQIRLRRELFVAPHQFMRIDASCALVSRRRKIITIHDHNHAVLERRHDFGFNMFAAILDERLDLLLNRQPAGQRGVPQHLPPFSRGGLLGANDPEAARRQCFLQEMRLRCFTRAVDAFDGDEEAGEIRGHMHAVDNDNARRGWSRIRRKSYEHPFTGTRITCEQPGEFTKPVNVYRWCARRGSNPQPSASEADALSN